MSTGRPVARSTHTPSPQECRSGRASPSPGGRHHGPRWQSALTCARPQERACGQTSTARASRAWEDTEPAADSRAPRYAQPVHCQLSAGSLAGMWPGMSAPPGRQLLAARATSEGRGYALTLERGGRHILLHIVPQQRQHVPYVSELHICTKVVAKEGVWPCAVLAAALHGGQRGPASPASTLPCTAGLPALTPTHASNPTLHTSLAPGRQPPPHPQTNTNTNTPTHHS